MQIYKPSRHHIGQPPGLSFKYPPPPPIDKAKLWRQAASKVGLSDPARLRLEWMIFYYTVAVEKAYPTARHFGTTPRNFYKWLRRFEKQGVRGLEEQSRTPHQTRHWEVTRVEEERIKDLRRQFLRYGKTKLKIIYADIHGEAISTWKIERVIRRHKLYPSQQKVGQLVKKGKPKPRIAQLEIKPEPYFLFHLDTIVIYYGSLKRYIITAIDHEARIGYARMYTTPSSKNARDFLHRLHYLVGEPIVHIHTDNGSEFKGMFEVALEELDIPHWFSRVKTPKDNARCERFNETLQYEWLLDGNFNPNVNEFNHALTRWLVEYNFLRPHQALNYLTPMKYLENKQTANLLPMWPASTMT